MHIREQKGPIYTVVNSFFIVFKEIYEVGDLTFEIRII